MAWLSRTMCFQGIPVVIHHGGMPEDDEAC